MGSGTPGFQQGPNSAGDLKLGLGKAPILFTCVGKPDRASRSPPRLVNRRSFPLPHFFLSLCVLRAFVVRPHGVPLCSRWEKSVDAPNRAPLGSRPARFNPITDPNNSRPVGVALVEPKLGFPRTTQAFCYPWLKNFPTCSSPRIRCASRAPAA